MPRTNLTHETEICLLSVLIFNSYFNSSNDFDQNQNSNSLVPAGNFENVRD